jgi:hypothetical protein
VLSDARATVQLLNLINKKPQDETEAVGWLRKLIAASQSILLDPVETARAEIEWRPAGASLEVY